MKASFYIALVASLAFAAPAWGQPSAGGDKVQAREHAKAGHEAFKAGNHQRAIDEFQAAEAIVHAPPHLLFIARSQAALGQLLAARATYEKLVAETLPADAPPPFQRAVAEGKTDLAALQGKIPALSIEIVADGDTSGAVVTVDGEAVAAGRPVAVDPGLRVVEVRLSGYQPATLEREVAAGSGVSTVSVTLSAATGDVAPEPAPAAAPAAAEGDWFPLQLALIGAGAASLAAGAITGGLAVEKMGRLRDACPNNPCPPTNQPLKDEVETFATVSTVTIVVGAVLAAGGITWLTVDLTTGDGDTAGLLGYRGTF